jgi:hypothetical protein
MACLLFMPVLLLGACSKKNKLDDTPKSNLGYFVESGSRLDTLHFHVSNYILLPYVGGSADRYSQPWQLNNGEWSPAMVTGNYKMEDGKTSLVGNWPKEILINWNGDREFTVKKFYDRPGLPETLKFEKIR